MNDDFNYDPELEDAEYEAKKILKGMNSLQQKQMQEQLNKKFAKKTAKYNKRLQESGFTQAELNRLYQENPGLYDQALDHAFKGFNKTIKAAATGRNQKGQFTRQPVAQQPVSPKPVKSLEEIQQTDYARNSNDRLNDIVDTVLSSLPPEMLTP